MNIWHSLLFVLTLKYQFAFSASVARDRKTIHTLAPIVTEQISRTAVNDNIREEELTPALILKIKSISSFESAYPPYPPTKADKRMIQKYPPNTRRKISLSAAPTTFRMAISFDLFKTFKDTRAYMLVAAMITEINANQAKIIAML